MPPLILRVNVGGQPITWIPWQEAALLYVKGLVAWTSGDPAVRLHGGIRRATGLQSFLDLHPVIAARGAVKVLRSTPPLTNRELFRRDRHTCLYCLAELSDAHLTRDHVVPISRGGRDIWKNVVTACRRCNQHKGARTPEQAGMRLCAVPYAPSYAEWLILHNRKILADQMAFLRAHCPKDSPWRRQ